MTTAAIIFLVLLLALVGFAYVFSIRITAQSARERKRKQARADHLSLTLSPAYQSKVAAERSHNLRREELDIKRAEFALKKHIALHRVQMGYYSINEVITSVTSFPSLAHGRENTSVVEAEVGPPSYPAPYDFYDVLSGWRPSREQMFLLRTSGLEDITVPMGKTYHVGLAGPTGVGKTNILRLVMAQSLFCNVLMYLANPNYAPIKINEHAVEDWRPIAARLAAPPARRIEDICEMLDMGVRRLDERREQQQRDPRPFQPLYMGYGEWPAIVSMLVAIYGPKDANKYIMKFGRLLREARQYNMFVISEFQDALVATIGGSSGMRENFRTALYGGGDPTTARALLDLKPGEALDETGLGDKGTVMLRCATAPLVRGRAPYCSNRAIYVLLGEPEFRLPDRVEHLDEEMLAKIPDLGEQGGGGSSAQPPQYQRTTGPLAVVSPPLSTEKRRARLTDAIEVWNELGGVGRPRLQSELQARGFECSEDWAKQLLRSIKQQLEDTGGAGDV